MKKQRSICKIEDDGSKWWYLDDRTYQELHRENGPAVVCPDGTKYWLLHDKYHREDGPAMEHEDGSKEWFLDDLEYTESEYYKELYKRKKITKKELFLHLI